MKLISILRYRRHFINVASLFEIYISILSSNFNSYSAIKFELNNAIRTLNNLKLTSRDQVLSGTQVFMLLKAFLDDYETVENDYFFCGILFLSVGRMPTTIESLSRKLL